MSFYDVCWIASEISSSFKDRPSTFSLIGHLINCRDYRFLSQNINSRSLNHDDIIIRLLFSYYSNDNFARFLSYFFATNRTMFKRSGNGNFTVFIVVNTVWNDLLPHIMQLWRFLPVLRVLQAFWLQFRYHQFVVNRRLCDYLVDS